MSVRNYLTLLIVGMSLAACASRKVEDLKVQDWVGHKGDDLVRAWGTPHHSYPTADGGKAIGYSFTDHVTGARQTVHNIKNCMVNFEIDRNGIIDDATTTGKNCSIGSQN